MVQQRLRVPWGGAPSWPPQGSTRGRGLPPAGEVTGEVTGKVGATAPQGVCFPTSLEAGASAQSLHRESGQPRIPYGSSVTAPCPEHTSLRRGKKSRPLVSPTPVSMPQLPSGSTLRRLKKQGQRGSSGPPPCGSDSTKADEDPRERALC